MSCGCPQSPLSLLSGNPPKGGAVAEGAPIAANEDSPLLGRDNAIVTLRAAFYSVEALEELRTKMRERCGAGAVGGRRPPVKVQ